MPENEVKQRRPRHRHDDEVTQDATEDGSKFSLRLIVSCGMVVIGIIMALGYSGAAFETGVAPPAGELEKLLKALGEVFKIILTTTAE